MSAGKIAAQGLGAADSASPQSPWQMHRASPASEWGVRSQGWDEQGKGDETKVA